MSINAKVKERITSNLKKYQNIVNKAVNNDINESDTVTIITDILCNIFGFDKFDNITSEYAIRKTYCDLAIKINANKPSLLIECKAIGIDLKEEHIRQATNYGAEEGVEWVILTNAKNWKIYKLIFSQPIDKQLVFEFDLLELSARKPETIDILYPLCIESFPKGKTVSLDNLYEQKQVFNRYVIGQLILSDEVITALRRKFKRLFPDIKIDNEDLCKLTSTEIVKREIVDPEQIKDAIKIIRKAEKKVSPKKTTNE